MGGEVTMAADAEKFVRFNIDAELWKRFRLLALKHDRSASDYLADLVDKEVKREQRNQDRRDARADR